MDVFLFASHIPSYNQFLISFFPSPPSLSLPPFIVNEFQVTESDRNICFVPQLHKQHILERKSAA
jgi:hypothetical protein